MEKNITNIVVLSAVWVISLVAGIALVRQALREQPESIRPRMKRLAKEIGKRLKLAAGVGLLAWVASGLIWVLINWR
jgi:hypothetical protein